MSAFRFIGSESTLGFANHPTDHEETKLTRFGQKIELPDEKAHNAMKGGCALLPEADFDAIGFTEQEVSIYAYPGQRIDAPVAFTDKLREAVQKYIENVKEMAEVR